VFDAVCLRSIFLKDLNERIRNTFPEKRAESAAELPGKKVDDSRFKIPISGCLVFSDTIGFSNRMERFIGFDVLFFLI
jgi:hypothetical protein